MLKRRFVGDIPGVYKLKTDSAASQGLQHLFSLVRSRTLG